MSSVAAGLAGATKRGRRFNDWNHFRWQALNLVLHHARAGTLDRHWRETEVAALVEEWRRGEPAPVDRTSPLYTLSSLGVDRERQTDYERAVLALTEVIEIPVADWEPLRGPSVGPLRAIHAWHVASLELLNEKRNVRRGLAAGAHGARFHQHLEECHRQGCDVLSESYEAALAGAGIAVDWVSRSRARITEWPGSAERTMRLQWLEDPEIIAHWENLPPYWTLD